jgi:predicted acyltransferase
MMPTVELNKTTSLSAGRLHSLDALRGFDMWWIVCGEGIFHGLAAAIKEKYGLVQSTIDWQIRGDAPMNLLERSLVGMSNQLHHTVWNGFTFYDLIFPLFIFIAGVSMPYSMGKQLDKAGTDQTAARQVILRSLIKRTITLILLGMLVNGALQLKGYEQTRFASVLGRIALGCFGAALIYLYVPGKKIIYWITGILLAYWALLYLVPVPGFGAGVITPEGNITAWFDRNFLPGKLHRLVYDPEGLLSTLPAVASALLGVLCGQYLRLSAPNGFLPVQALRIFIAGLTLLLAGWLWNFVFPVNKILWSSSYVLVAGGWSMMALALFYFIIDVKGYRNWSRPLVWIGTNSILIYVAAHGLVNFESTSQFLFGGLISLAPAAWHSALLWTGVGLIQLAGLYILYRNRLFWKV